MENVNDTVNEAAPAEAVQNATIRRSASYPALTVSEAFNYASKINEKFSTAEVTRKEIANVFKVHPNTISREVAATTAYGFFDKVLHKGESDFKYKLSQLFNDTFLYENEKQKKINLIMAFGKPKLYSELISKFDGSVIPQELPNTLIKHHNITNAAAQEVADIFIKAGTEVGVINENRVLNYKVTLGAVQKTQYAEIIDENVNHEFNGTGGGGLLNPPATVIHPEFADTSAKKVPIYLTRGKMCYLLYPSDITSNDIKLIEYEIKGILLRLELEQQEAEEERKKQKEQV